MITPYLQAHTRLVTNDLDEAREHVGRNWERHRSQLWRCGGYELSWHQVDLKNVSLSYMHTSGGLRVDCGPVGDTYRLTMPEEGGAVCRIDGTTVEATVARGALYRPGQELNLNIDTYRSLLLAFDGEFARKSIERRFEASPVYPVGIALDAPAPAALRSLCRWMGQELDRPESALLASTRVSASLERALLALFLDAVEANAPAVEAGTLDAGHAHVQRIEEWLDVHFAEPIGVEDMAAAAEVSVRAMQDAFRRLRGCTPTEALLRRRMEHAHRTLRAGAPGTTVTDAAFESGVFHLGRFAERYARMYGERPSETLARSRGGVLREFPEDVRQAS
jgi:AraC-like DNA-binding protein